MSDDLPMHDVVELVLQAEGESKRILDDAQAEAERIVAEARSKAQDIVQTTRRETVAQAEEIVGNAERNAQRDKEEQLAQAAVEIDNVAHLSEQSTENAIQAILRCVCGGP